MGKQKEDLSGQVFGYLTVVSFDQFKSGKNHWNCICICGIKTSVAINNLKRKTRSCGCKKVPFKKHGLGGTKIYDVWWQMIDRCYNEKNKHFDDYGGRGITVCNEWRDSITKFYSDMGEPPVGMKLERIDNNKGYCKKNCKWATSQEQSENKRCTIRLIHKGELITLVNLAKKIGANRNVLHAKYKRGEDLSQIEKVNPRGSHSKRIKLHYLPNKQ